jgi:predicted nucleic acid-binding protein
MSMLLDTNLPSELWRAQPSPAVLSWFAEQAAPGLFVSAVTQAGMLLGAAAALVKRRQGGVRPAAQVTCTDARVRMCCPCRRSHCR